MKKPVYAVFISSLLAACGGGGGNPSTEPSLPAADTVAQQCETPRPFSIIDPLTQQAYGDGQGSRTTERLWIRSFVNVNWGRIPIRGKAFALATKGYWGQIAISSEPKAARIWALTPITRTPI
jgi:hypothetical protein